MTNSVFVTWLHYTHSLRAVRFRGLPRNYGVLRPLVSHPYVRPCGAIHLKLFRLHRYRRFAVPCNRLAQDQVTDMPDTVPPVTRSRRKLFCTFPVAPEILSRLRAWQCLAGGGGGAALPPRQPENAAAKGYSQLRVGYVPNTFQLRPSTGGGGTGLTSAIFSQCVPADFRECGWSKYATFLPEIPVRPIYLLSTHQFECNR